MKNKRPACCLGPLTHSIDEDGGRRSVCQFQTEWTMSLDSDEIERLLLAEKLAVTRVATIEDVATNPQLQHRGHFVDVEHPIQGKVKVAGPAVRFSGHPMPKNHRIPLAGEHTDEVLSDWLEYDPKQLEVLRAAGTIGQTAKA